MQQRPEDPTLQVKKSRRAVGLLALLVCSFGWLSAPKQAGAQEQDEGVIVSHGISAFGDLRYPPGFAHFDYVNPTAPKGGTMSFRGSGASRTFDSLNNFILQGEPAQGLTRLYDSLLVRSMDEPDSAYGLIAESLEHPTDRGWVVFNMRPEARFSDGNPITADDVVFSIETLRTQGLPYYRITLSDVETVEAIDTHQVKFTFAPDAATRDLPLEVGQIPILPKHYYETVVFDESTLDPPVGSGQFIVSDVKPGRSITYCRQPDYWGAALPVNVGTANFDCFVYEYFTDNTAAFEAFKVGEYLFHEEFTSALWATNYEFSAVERGSIIRDTLKDGRSSGAQGFWMNLRRPLLQDPLVREAISLMFNFEWSNETLFYGLYERTDSFWENSTLQATGPLEGAELELLEEFRNQLPPEVFSEPAYSSPVSTSRKADRRAIREASRLLNEAGWRVGEDGLMRNAEGETLTIEFVSDSPAFERIVLPFIDNLRRVGVDALYEQVDPAQMQQRQEDFDYDITIARLVLSLTPSVELRTLFGSQSADAPGTLNLAGVADPVVDALIERIIAAETREDMEMRVRALDRVLRAKHIWVPNWYKGTHWVAYWDVFGRPAQKPPFARGVDYWWFDQSKLDALRASGALP